MPNPKSRHAFNRCYASLPLPRWNLLSPIEAAIKTWIKSLLNPSNNNNIGGPDKVQICLSGNKRNNAWSRGKQVLLVCFEINNYMQIQKCKLLPLCQSLACTMDLVHVQPVDNNSKVSHLKYKQIIVIGMGWAILLDFINSLSSNISV